MAAIVGSPLRSNSKIDLSPSEMELTLNNLVAALVLGSMGLVLLFAMISRSHRLQARARAGARTVVCRLCLNAYQQQDRAQLSECPACGARNERGYHKAPR